VPCCSTIDWSHPIDIDLALDALPLPQISHAEYLARRGHRCRIVPLLPVASLPFGARVATVGARELQYGFEQFQVGFTMPEAEPVQGMYRIILDGLPEHALLLVPYVEADGSVMFDATFSRQVEARAEPLRFNPDC
jgi:hypothetical protein